MPKISLNAKAFSLIELIIVVAIIAVLMMLIFVSYTQVQKNARDTKRKGDLQTVAGTLQRFYSDYSRFPASDGFGLISYNSAGCGSDLGATATPWGTGAITCGSTSYIKQLPADPQTSNLQYCYYRPDYQHYQLYAKLEASGTTGTYTNPTGCPGGTYNYLVTPND